MGLPYAWSAKMESKESLSLSVIDVPDSTARYAIPIQGSRFGISVRWGRHMDDTADFAP